jgi:hypothetical protein
MLLEVKLLSLVPVITHGDRQNTISFNEVCENTAWIIFGARYFIEGEKRLDVVNISLFQMQFVMSDDRKTAFF